MNKSILKRYLPFLTFIIFCIYIITLELSYYFDSSLGKVGIVLWYMLGVLLITHTILEFFGLLKKVSKGHFIVPIVIFLILNVVGIFYMSRPENISLEATQQVSCAINNFSVSEDWGYFQNCFLGYPARQFLMPLIPSLVGNSVFALHLGNYIYFLIGQVLFLSVSAKWISSTKKIRENLVSMLLIIPFHFHFFNYLNLTFEQAFYPIGLGLILFSTLLNMKLQINVRNILIFLISGLLIISSYTTALAYIPLIFLFGLYFLIIQKSSKKHKTIILSSLITLAVSLVVSLAYRGDLRFENNKEVLDKEKTELIVRTIFGFSDGLNFVSPVFTLIWILTLVSALLFKFRLLGVVFLVWVIAVFHSSISTHGYAGPDMVFSLYRASVLIPPMLFLLLYNRVSFFNKKYSLIVVLILLISGLLFQYDYYKTKADNKSVILYELYTTLNREIEPPKEKLYLFELDKEPFLPILNGSGYFMKDIEVIFTKDLCIVDSKNSAILTDKAIPNVECENEVDYNQLDQKSLTIEGINDTLYLYQ